MALVEPSKSERKRDASRLQNLGRSLTLLNATQLAEVPIPEALVKAISDYQRFGSNEARRRQLQFIGKLMRKADTASIEAALERIQGRSARARFRFRQLEAWRDRLIAEPSALTQYLAEHPGAERQQLRHLIKRAHQAAEPNQQKAAARALFRFLRDTDPEPDQAD